MIEITASDIFWIGAMDKIEIGLIVMFLFALFLVFMAVDSSSVAIFLFALLLGIFSMTAWVFIPSSKTLAAMKVLPAIVNNQRIQGVVGRRRFRREIVRIRDLLPNHRLEERQDVLVQGAGQE